MADSIIRRGRDTHVNSGAPDKQYAQVKFPRVTSGTHYIYVHLPLPGVRGKTIESAVLSVPSVLVPQERNYLLNPAHPDFARIKRGKPKAFAIDPRFYG